MRIVIPLIQRDYAQGRLNVSDTHVRKEFVKVIAEALSKGKPLNLDFVYGKIEKADSGESHKFIPLDGQQRLTTLFLFHWYLAPSKGKESEFDSQFVLGSQSRFTYETRFSSVDFFNKLCACDKNQLISEKITKFSALINDCSWFKTIWLSDPTVMGVLNMLDAIHEECKNHTLKNVNLDSITFDFLDLDNFGLTDELYVRMNARGLPLSEYEKHKSNLIGKIGDSILNSPAMLSNVLNVFKIYSDMYYKNSIYSSFACDSDFAFYFTSRLDVDWTKFVWNNLGNIPVSNFKYTAIDDILSSRNNDLKIKSKEEAFDLAQINMLSEIAGFVIAGSKNDYETSKGRLSDFALNSKFLEYVELIIHMFDISGLLSWSINNNSSSVIDNHWFLDVFMSGSITYPQRVLFYSLIRYFILFNGDISNQYASESSLGEWCRFTYNLVSNSSIEDWNEYSRCIQVVDEILGILLDSNISINTWLISAAKFNIRGFDSIQFEEEVVKAQIILADSTGKWLDSIRTAESNRYLKGKIGFLLAYLSDGTFPLFQSLELKQDVIAFLNDRFDVFSNYAEVVGSFLEHLDSNIFLLERAALTVGDNYTSYYNRRQLYFKYESVNGWRKLFVDTWEQARYQSNISPNFLCLKYLMDIYFTSDSIDVQVYLLNIIDSYDDTDWKYCLIKDHRLLQYMSHRNLVLHNSQYVYLLPKSNWTSVYSELYSRFLFELLRDNNGGAIYYDREKCACVVFNLENSSGLKYFIDIRHIPTIGRAYEYSGSWSIFISTRQQLEMDYSVILAINKGFPHIVFSEDNIVDNIKLSFVVSSLDMNSMVSFVLDYVTKFKLLVLV